MTMGQIADDRLKAYTRMTDLEDSRDFAFPDIRGWKVLNTTGHPVGTVEEVFVDPNTLEPGWALLHYQKFLNFNTKKLLVAWSELRLGDKTVQTRPSEESLAEPFETEELLTAEPMASS
jgi:sporulation protein YlmC with PRC-barrel domain